SLDFQTHLAALEANGLLVRVDKPINKDMELHPLVRWQFLGGIPEDERRAFLFTNVVDSRGRHYDIPVAVGALAASAKIYALGMGRAVDEIGAAWTHAIANRRGRRLSALAEISRARRADALRHRHRLRARGGLHGSAEARRKRG